MNPEVLFTDRQYAAFDVTPKTIKLTRLFDVIQHEKQMYLHVAPKLHAALYQLSAIKHQEELRTVQGGDLFPNVAGLNLLVPHFLLLLLFFFFS